MKVCFFGTYRANYSRNQIVIKALRQTGVEVIECHEQLWNGIEDRERVASGSWFSISFVWRLMKTYTLLLKRYHRLGGDYDILLLGYPGQLDVFIARLLTWIHRKPLVMDLFMSIYLVAHERNIQRKSTISVKLLYALEYIACRLPDRLICDTEAYVNWYCSTYRLSYDNFRLVPTGADQQTFHPLFQKDHNEIERPFRVLYYGSFIRNHGVKIVIEAARKLRDHDDLIFELIGDGPEKQSAMELTQTYGLDHVQFFGWMERNQLMEHIARADLLLGVFGTTPQSMMTIQNKIYEGLAMRQAIITGTSATIKNHFIHGEHLYLVERENAEVLARSIFHLQSRPELLKHMADTGHAYFDENFGLKRLGQSFSSHLHELN